MLILNQTAEQVPLGKVRDHSYTHIFTLMSVTKFFLLVQLHMHHR